MHETHSPEVEAFLAQARGALRSSAAPAPGAQLAAMFEAHADLPPAPVAPRRRTTMINEHLRTIPGKVAAGIFGAALVLSGLGVAGAMTGTLASNDTPIVTDQSTTTTSMDTTTTVADTTTTDSPDTSSPTSDSGNAVSAAAHDHSHDEACGNHGHYVSAIAKGETPDCASGTSSATSSTSGDSEDSSDATDATESTESESPTVSSGSTTSSHGHGHGGH